jgi:hypothetical protein
MNRPFESERLSHEIAEVPRRQPQLEMTIGTDLGDVWSHYCTRNQGGGIVGRGRFFAQCFSLRIVNT